MTIRICNHGPRRRRFRLSRVGIYSGTRAFLAVKRRLKFATVPISKVGPHLRPITMDKATVRRTRLRNQVGFAGRLARPMEVPYCGTSQKAAANRLTRRS